MVVTIDRGAFRRGARHDIVVVRFLPRPVHIPVRFLDAEGFTWQAVEVATPSPGDTVGALYFFSRGATRRLAGYPVDWSEGDWGALDALRRRADVLWSDGARAVEAST
jgi:hypothetical protein